MHGCSGERGYIDLMRGCLGERGDFESVRGCSSDKGYMESLCCCSGEREGTSSQFAVVRVKVHRVSSRLFG